ncbi:MAG: ADP-glyceromanno-heptose 6-epimerase, partial [Pseudomonadota bacterium]|nr:ADP-glyceromanno-heptose 6-epimerase [Pseudomonadota bacterium]
KINYIDMPQQLKGKYQYFTEADMTKLRAVGYDQPFTELEDGIRDYVQNYLSSKDQYE